MRKFRVFAALAIVMAATLGAPLLMGAPAAANERAEPTRRRGPAPARADHIPEDDDPGLRHPRQAISLSVSRQGLLLNG